MPHEWNNIWVVTQEELVPQFFNTESTLHNAIQRYQKRDYGIKKVQSGGNGRKLLIAFDSLEKEKQDAIGDPRKLKHILDMFYTVDNDAVRFYTSNIEGIGYLSLAHQEEYITNANVLKACVSLKAARENERKTKGGSLKGIMSSLCADVNSYNDILEKKHKVCHTLPSTERWFKEAFKAFATPFKGGYNYPSLISKKLEIAIPSIVVSSTGMEYIYDDDTQKAIAFIDARLDEITKYYFDVPVSINKNL